MKNLKQFIIERLKLTKNSKLEQLPNYIVFPAKYSENEAIRAFLHTRTNQTSKFVGIEYENAGWWSIYVISKEYIDDLIKYFKEYDYQADIDIEKNIGIYELPNNYTNDKFQKEWQKVDFDYNDEAFAYLDKHFKKIII